MGGGNLGMKSLNKDRTLSIFGSVLSSSQQSFKELGGVLGMDD